MSTKLVASPMAMPLMTALVTARVGHMPRSWRKTGFSSQRPLRYSARKLLVDMAVSAYELAFLFDLPQALKR